MGQRWTDAECAALDALHSGLSVAALQEAYNVIAAEQGWPLRSAIAVRNCRARRGARAGKTRWSRRELAHLEDLVGDRPVRMVVRDYNRWATRNGLPVRTQHAINHQMTRLGLETRVQGAWINSGIVKRLLQKSSKSLCNWVDRGWVRRCGRNWQTALNRSDLQQLARERPHLFGGLPWDDLFTVLEDAELTDAICAAHPKRLSSRNSTTAVVCITNGRLYPSIRAASEALHMSSSSISWSLAKERPICGHQFRRVA